MPIIVHSTHPAVKPVQAPIAASPVEIALVLDQSSSMVCNSAEVVSGYNTLLSEQKTISPDTRVSLTLFDSDVHQVYQSRNITDAEPLTLQTYKPQGATALYDGVMAAVNSLAKRVEEIPVSPRVVVAILTDGEETASRFYGLKEVKESIIYRQTLGWRFLFLGPHAIRKAHALGIPIRHALTITTSAEGIKHALHQLKGALASIQLGNSTEVFRLR